MPSAEASLSESPKLFFGDFRIGQLIHHQKDGLVEIIDLDPAKERVSYRIGGVECRGIPFGMFLSEAEWIVQCQKKNFSNLINQAWPKIELKIESIRAESKDLDLVESWNAGDESLWPRNCSARLAERAVMRFLKDNLGCDPNDISIQQLDHAHGGDWESHDITCKGICYDVKNSRQSERNPNAYVSHCVPKFKTSRSGEDVEIVGVLSPWRSPTDLNRTGSGETKILGFVTRKRLSELSQLVGKTTLEIPWEPADQSPHMLPPWVFDFPDSFYSGRSEALRKLRELSMPPPGTLDHPSLIPSMIAAGCDSIPEPLLQQTWEQNFACNLISRCRELGASLPVIFLAVLEHFLRMIVSEPENGYRPAAYRRFLFRPHDTEERPLCTADPLKTVSSLITSLDAIWDACKQRPFPFRQFQLKGWNILRGRAPGEQQWTTLLAYCGGWVPSAAGKSKPCGTTPLIWGECNSCSNGRLVCSNPDCCYCCSEHHHPLSSSLETEY